MKQSKDSTGVGEAVRLDPARAAVLADHIRARMAERPDEGQALEKLLPAVEKGKLRLPSWREH